MIANVVAWAYRGCVLALAITTLSWPAQAQQPSPNAILLAKEIIIVKGANKIYEPVIAEVIDRSKQVLVQTNPMLSNDLNEIAGRLIKAFSPRITEVLNEVARLYAVHFTEQELKNALAFYKSPLGKKIIEQEPVILDQTVIFTEQWAGKLSEEVLARYRAELRKKGHNL